VLNKTTVYQRLQDIFSQYQDGKHAQDTATKELVGQVNIFKMIFQKIVIQLYRKKRLKN